MIKERRNGIKKKKKKIVLKNYSLMGFRNVIVFFSTDMADNSSMITRKCLKFSRITYKIVSPCDEAASSVAT